MASCAPRECPALCFALGPGRWRWEGGAAYGRPRVRQPHATPRAPCCLRLRRSSAGREGVHSAVHPHKRLPLALDNDCVISRCRALVLPPECASPTLEVCFLCMLCYATKCDATARVKSREAAACCVHVCLFAGSASWKSTPTLARHGFASATCGASIVTPSQATDLARFPRSARRAGHIRCSGKAGKTVDLPSQRAARVHTCMARAQVARQLISRHGLVQPDPAERSSASDRPPGRGAVGLCSAPRQSFQPYERRACRPRQHCSARGGRVARVPAALLPSRGSEASL